MNVEEILNKIKEYKDYKNNNTHWSKKEIQLPDNGGKFEVKGFGICNDDNFDKGSFRYYLEFEIINPQGNKGNLVSIMMNPSSETNPNNNKIDSTVTNVIRMAYVSGYSKVIILNSFPYINGNGTESLEKNNNSKDSQENKLNKDFINNFLKANVNNQDIDILLAWGGNIKNTVEDYSKFLKPYENQNKIYVYNITKNSFPMHPSPFNKEKVNNALKSKTCLKNVKLKCERRKKIAVDISKKQFR